MRRIFRSAAYAIAGLALAVGMTAATYAIGGRDLSEPVRFVRAPQVAPPAASAAPSPEDSPSPEDRPSVDVKGGDNTDDEDGSDSDSGSSDSGSGSADSHSGSGSSGGSHDDKPDDD